MRILIDIGHPAHVHYFKHFIWEMQKKKHELLIIARDKEVSFNLLNSYNIPYLKRGKGGKGIFSKILYILKADFVIIRAAFKFKPDLFLSFASTYAAHAAFFLHKPHIAFDDTEHAKFELFMYPPFTKTILNPSCFNKMFSKKQILFKGYMELCYLHPKYFTPDPDILKKIGVSEGEKFVLLRFVSWKASHDIGHSGLDIETKKKMVNILIEKGYKIFISAEAENKDPFFDKYHIKISPELIHHVMAYATLLVTEGATMASECAMLGTPAIYVNSLDAGTLREQEDKYQLIHGFRSSAGLLEKVNELLSTPNLRETYKQRRQKMLSEKIDVTAFMVWFVENYPQSAKFMKENQEYQDQFR